MTTPADDLRARALSIAGDKQYGAGLMVVELVAALDRVTAERDGLVVDVGFYTGKLSECGNRIIDKDAEIERLTAERDQQRADMDEAVVTLETEGDRYRAEIERLRDLAAALWDEVPA